MGLVEQRRVESKNFRSELTAYTDVSRRVSRQLVDSPEGLTERPRYYRSAIVASSQTH